MAHCGQRKRIWEPRITLHVSSPSAPFTQGLQSYPHRVGAFVPHDRNTSPSHLSHNNSPHARTSNTEEAPQGEQRSLIHQISRRSTSPATNDEHLHGASTTIMIPEKDRAIPLVNLHMIVTPFGHSRAHGERCPPQSNRVSVGSLSSAGCSVSTDHYHHQPHHSPYFATPSPPMGVQRGPQAVTQTAPFDYRMTAF